jgi:hypothetical protein
MMSEAPGRPPRPFNGPLETGLRALLLLDAIAPQDRDLQRLVYYDYLLLHSGDVTNGPRSLHPPIPYRSGEILVRRQLTSRGLELMFSKELVVKRMSAAGITHAASDLCRPFLGYLRSEYVGSLRASAKWVAQTFESYSDAALGEFMTANLGRWGAEFNRESLLRGARQ